MISYLEFTKGHLNFFQSLIYFPEYKERLRKNADSTFGFVYFEEKQPLLVAIGDLSGEIYYLKLLAPYEDAGIIEVALQHIESFYKKRNIEQVRLQFKCTEEELLLFRMALARRQWDTPAQSLHFSIMGWEKFFGNSLELIDAELLEKRVVNWPEVSLEQRHFIKRKEKTGAKAANDRRFHGETSLVLMDNEKPIGWILTEQSATNMIFVRDVFIHPDHRQKKLGSRLMTQFRNELRKYPAIEFVMFDAEPENKIMNILVKKRFPEGGMNEKLYFKSMKEL